MKELKFIQGATPRGFKPDFETFLFDEEKHRMLQTTQGWVSFGLVRMDKKKILALVHFNIHGGIARSPFRAPFGSVRYSSSLEAKELSDFLKNVEKALKAKGVKRLLIKNPPGHYNYTAESILGVLLLNHGFEIRDAEISTSILVDDSKYEQRVEGWELRKLKQARKAKLRFESMALTSVEQVYKFIKSCRVERGQSLSMTFPELKATIEEFRENFFLFGVYKDTELAAASVAIRVSKTILYNFYSGHPKKFDSLSPVVLLINGMYEWCRENKIQMIDLGTSSIDDHPNFGLLDFKFRLGGIPSAKFTFEKAL